MSGRSFGASRWRAFRQILLPALYPYVITAMRIGLVHAIRAMVVAEMFIIVGYGGLIYRSGLSTSTAPLLALLVTLMLVGVIGERAVTWRSAHDRPLVRAASRLGKRNTGVNFEEEEERWLTRRDALKAAAAAGLSPFVPAFAQGEAAVEGQPAGLCARHPRAHDRGAARHHAGHGLCAGDERLDQIRTLTQTLIAGAAELGETDSITVMSAVEQGADLKIVGLWYMHTSLVFLVNADKVREFKDLEKPDNIVAINGKGDITHVMLLGPLIKRGVDVKKLNIVEIGGSGARMQALQSGRVAAVPVHFDQAAEVAKKGNFKILLEPWKEYGAWINEIWACQRRWLKKKENERRSSTS